MKSITKAPPGRYDMQLETSQFVLCDNELQCEQVFSILSDEYEGFITIKFPWIPISEAAI